MGGATYAPACWRVRCKGRPTPRLYALFCCWEDLFAFLTSKPTDSMVKPMLGKQKDQPLSLKTRNRYVHSYHGHTPSVAGGGKVHGAQSTHYTPHNQSPSSRLHCKLYPFLNISSGSTTRTAVFVFSYIAYINTTGVYANAHNVDNSSYH